MILSALINQYLAQDVETANKLAEHEGKILKIELLGLHFISHTPKVFFIFIHQDHISLSQKSDLTPHTIVRGTPLNLMGVWLSKTHTLSDDIEITGDVLFLQSLRNIFKNIDIDWTEVLSKFTGDPIAYAASRFCRKLNQWKDQTSRNINRDLKEYLQEERRFLVPRMELEDFYKTIDDLRDGTERLQTRLEILESST